MGCVDGPSSCPLLLLHKADVAPPLCRWGLMCWTFRGKYWLLRQRPWFLRGALDPLMVWQVSLGESAALSLLVGTLHIHSSSLPLVKDKLWTGGRGASYVTRVLQSLDSGEVSDQCARHKIEEVGGPQHPLCCFRVQGGRNPLVIGLIVHLLSQRFNSNVSF